MLDRRQNSISDHRTWHMCANVYKAIPRLPFFPYICEQLLSTGVIQYAKNTVWSLCTPDTCCPRYAHIPFLNNVLQIPSCLQSFGIYGVPGIQDIGHASLTLIRGTWAFAIYQGQRIVTWRCLQPRPLSERRTHDAGMSNSLVTLKNCTRYLFWPPNIFYQPTLTSRRNNRYAYTFQIPMRYVQKLSTPNTAQRCEGRGMFLKPW